MKTHKAIFLISQKDDEPLFVGTLQECKDYKIRERKFAQIVPLTEEEIKSLYKEEVREAYGKGRYNAITIFQDEAAKENSEIRLFVLKCMRIIANDILPAK